MYEQEPVKKVALIGLGAIGSFLASHLQTVLGDNLRIIAGGERKERLEREGVVVNGKQLHFHLVDPAESCGGDYPQLAIIITKFSGLAQALKDIKNQIGPHTIIMAPLNGVEKEEIVAAAYGWENLLYSLTRVSVVMKEGKVTFNDASAQMEFGEKKNETISPKVRAVKELFEAAGIRSVVPEDMERAIWLKYMCNVSENQSAAVLGLPFLVKGKKFYLKNQYTCSSYTARVLEECGLPISDKHFSLVTPKDVYEYKNMEVVFEGRLEDLVARDRRSVLVYQAAPAAHGAGLYRTIY